VTAVWKAGLQVERTALAWRRTTLSMLGASVLAVRLGLLRDNPAATVLALSSLVVWGVLAWRSRGRYREVSDNLVAGRPHRPLLSGGWAATGVTLLAMATLVLLT